MGLATASTCPIASWPVCPFALPRARPTWRRWPRRPTTGEPTGSCSPRRHVGCSEAGNRDIPGPVVRRVAQPGQDRGARGPRPRAHPVCASERRDPLIAAAPSDLPADLAAVGQPVLIPARWAPRPTCWRVFPITRRSFPRLTAARVQSRHQAARHTNADALRRGLEESGILVRGSSPKGLAEEKPGAYKDIDAVIETSH